MEYLGSKATCLIQQQVHRSPVRMLPRDRKEEFVHAAVQNRGHGAGNGQLAMFLNREHLGKRVAHQRDWEWGATRKPVVPKPEPISEQVRPISVIRFLFHFVVECGKGGAGIAALIPLLEEGGDGAASVRISAVRALQQAVQTINIQGAAIQWLGKGFDANQRLIHGKTGKPSTLVDLTKCIWHAQARDRAVPLSMQPFGSRPILPIDRIGIGRQVR